MEKFKRLLTDNFLPIGTFCCFVCALELLRVPIYGATFITMLTQPPGNYDLTATLVKMLIVLADAAVLSLPAMFVTKRRWIVYLWIFLFDAYCLVQTWYISVYQDIMPFSHFLLFENVNGVLLRSVGGLMSWRDLLLFLPLAAFMAIGRLAIKNTGGKRYSRKHFLCITVATLSLYAVSVVYNLRNNESDRYSPFHPYLTVYELRGYVTDNGFIPFVIYSIANSMADRQLSDEEIAAISDFLQREDYNDNRFAPPARKNLILIIVESFNSWYLNRTVCGVEIMPRLNAMLKEEGTIAALNVLPQVKDGRSSDAHFTYNTGLLPLRTGSVAMSFADNEYPSLAKALKAHGYRSFNMVCDKASAWNQEELMKSLGFDEVIDRNKYTTTDDYIDDAQLFTNAVEKIKTMRQPFFAQIVTMSTHQPGYKPDTSTRLSDYPKGSEMLRNYMEDFHILDSQLYEFVTELKQSGIYDNSIIVIVGDHDEVGYNVFEGRKEQELSDKQIAFIALNTECTLSYSGHINQTDVYTTILDIAGCNDYKWKGLGHSILRSPAPDYAVYWDGRAIGGSLSPLSGYYRRAWDISSMIIRGNYFSKHRQQWTD